MSSYVRQSLGLNRPNVTFGSQRSRQSRDNGGGDENDRVNGSSQQRNGRSSGKTRFTFSNQPSQQRQQRQVSTVADPFSREVIFEEEVDIMEEDEEDVPIEGSIHANEEDTRNFSQVTLSQLSDGPNTSVRSHRSLSQPSGVSWNKQQSRHLVGGLQRGGAGNRGSSRSDNVHGKQHLKLSQSRQSGIGSRVGREHRSSRRQAESQAMHEDDEDNSSIRSSQPLISQYSRHSSSNTASRTTSSNSRPNSSRSSNSGRQQSLSQLAPFSQSRVTSSRPTSRGRQHHQDSRTHHLREDDNVSLQSQSLLSPLQSIPPRRLDSTLKRQSTTGAGGGSTLMSQRDQQLSKRGKSIRETPRSQRQQTTLAKFRTPSRLSSMLPPKNKTPSHPPPPSSSSRHNRSSTATNMGNTAIRTVGAISSTLASLPYTPSRAFRSMTNLAVKTTASLAGLTPFKGRKVRSGLLASSSTAASNAAIGSTIAASTSTATSSTPESRRELAAENNMEYSTTSNVTDGQTGEQAAGDARKMAPPQQVDQNTTLRDVMPNIEMNYFAPNNSEKTTMEGGHGGNGSARCARKMLTPKGCTPKSSVAQDEDRSHSNPLSSTSMVVEKMPVEEGSASGKDVRSDPRDNDVVMEPPKLQGSNGEGEAKTATSKYVGQEARKDDTSNTNQSNDKGSISEEMQADYFAEITIPKSNHKADNNVNDRKHHQDKEEDDAGSTTSSSTLDMQDKAEEIVLAASLRHRDDLQEQQEALDKSRREFEEMNDRAKQDWKEECVKLESMQRSTEAEFSILRESMDAFSKKIASSSHNQELAMRTLASQSMNEMREESGRAVELISNQANEMKAHLPSEIRALMEIEVRKYVVEMMVGLVADAKSEFQEWVDGTLESNLKKNMMNAPGETVASKNTSTGEAASNWVISHVGDGGINLENEDKTRPDLLSVQSNHSKPIAGCEDVNISKGNRINACDSVHVPVMSVRVETPAVNGDATDVVSSISAPGGFAVGDSTEKENMEPGPIISDQSESEATRVVKIIPMGISKADPVKSNQSGLVATSPGEGRNHVSSTSVSSPFSKKSSPVLCGVMSSSATPFSRKATPLQNNHAKNRPPAPSSDRSKHEIDLECELHNDFSIIMSPFSSRNANQVNATNEVSTDAKTKAKVAKKVSTTEPKHKLNALKKSASKESKRRNTSNPPKSNRMKQDEHSCENTSRPKASVDSAPKKVDVKEKRAPRTKITKTKRNTQPKNSTGPFKKFQRKRGQSDMMNVAKSPRRSKRLKEVHRVEHMAAVQIATATFAGAKEAKAKLRKVTPKDDATPPVDISAGDEGSYKIAHSSVICHSTSGAAAEKAVVVEKTGGVSNGYDSLLGTSVFVPADDKREDELIGFDEGEDVQPDKRSLSSLLPFGRLRGRKTKTMSKTKKMSKKKKSSFDFDFSFY